MLCQIISRTLLCNECVESVKLLSWCWTAIVTYSIGQYPISWNMHHTSDIFPSHACKYKMNSGLYIFATKIFRTDLTLSTHYKYRKLVRFHHKFHLKFFPTLQLSRSRVNLLQESQYRKSLFFFTFHYTAFFFYFWFFLRQKPHWRMCVYVCVKQAVEI